MKQRVVRMYHPFALYLNLFIESLAIKMASLCLLYEVIEQVMVKETGEEIWPVEMRQHQLCPANVPYVYVMLQVASH
jgi:hypothetical protein